MKWISVEGRLPEKDTTILLVIRNNDINDYSHPYTAEQAMSLAFYSTGHWWDETWPETEMEDNIIADVTHWMPLPDPPDKE